MSRLIENKPDMDVLRAAELLTRTKSLTMKIAETVGAPLEKLLEMIPDKQRESINEVVSAALKKAAQGAIMTMSDKPNTGASTIWHKLGAGASGAVGGLFGFAGVLVELPISITIMMRAVADVARAEGFSLSDPETALHCVSVFGMNTDSAFGPGESYYAAKEMMVGIVALTGAGLKESAAAAAAAAAAAGATQGFTQVQAAAMLSKIVEAVAARFGIVITEKVAAQLVPILGAVTAASINMLFTKHYQDVATGYFRMMRLEKKYGKAQFDEALLALK